MRALMRLGTASRFAWVAVLAGCLWFPFPAAAETAESLVHPSRAKVRLVQLGSGLLLGMTGAMVGGWAGKETDPCKERRGPDASDGSWVDFCNSSGTTIGAVSGYVLGAAAGIQLAGSLADRDGSFLMTLGGAGLGLLAGGWFASSFDDSPVLQITSLLALSQAAALAAYHWTDRVRLSAALEPGRPAGEPGPQAYVLRSRLQVTLARF